MNRTIVARLSVDDPFRESLEGDVYEIIDKDKSKKESPVKRVCNHSGRPPRDSFGFGESVWYMYQSELRHHTERHCRIR